MAPVAAISREWYRAIIDPRKAGVSRPRNSDGWHEKIPTAGDESAASASADAATATQGTVLDACAVLRGMDLSSYLGTPASEYKESLRSTTTSAGVTMYGAGPVGGLPLLTLMLRWGPKGADPRSIEEWVKTEWAADTVDLGAEMVADLRRAEVIAGVGNFAVGYSMGGVRVSAWWGPRHHLTATANSFQDKALARRAVEAVAREAIAKY